jgi:hypothetical protein
MEINGNPADFLKLLDNFKSTGEVDPWDFAKLFNQEENLVRTTLKSLQHAYSHEALEVCEGILSIMEKGKENRTKWLEMILKPFDLSAKLDVPTDHQRNGDIGNEYSLGVIRALFILARRLEDDRSIANKILDHIISLIFCCGNLIDRLNEALENNDCCGQKVKGNFQDILGEPIADFVLQKNAVINTQQAADVKFLISQIHQRVPPPQIGSRYQTEKREVVLPLCEKIINQIFYTQARQLSLSEKMGALVLLEQRR